MYPLEVIHKVARRFTNNYFVNVCRIAEGSYRITLENKEAEIELTQSPVDKEFTNELIVEVVRYRTTLATQVTRNLIIGRALYETCIINPPEKTEHAE